MTGSFYTLNPKYSGIFHALRRYLRSQQIIFRRMTFEQKDLFELGSNESNPKYYYSALRLFNIFLANGSFISLWRGTASITPVLGFIQSECD